MKDLSKKLKEKEDLLAIQNQKLISKEEELTAYINKLFEQQERERIIKWLISSIRESIELDKVLSKTVEEIGKLLKSDRCLIALYEPTTAKFNIQSEYKASEDIQSIFSEKSDLQIPKEWNNDLIENNNTIVINDVKELNLTPNNLFNFEDVKSLIAVPLADKNGILGIILVQQICYKRNWGKSHIELFEDISNQIAISIRQATFYSQVQETTKLKSAFLTSMSHEFRTPLNAIIGFSEMILTGNYGPLSSKQRDYLGNIAISGKHLLHLVNDILDLSKIESGNVSINYEKFNINQVINETVAILKSMAIKKSIKIDMKINETVLNADSRKFRQIMYNLLSNAIKFTEENGKIEIKSCIIEDKLKIEIEDNGIGIADKDRHKIFSEFRQIDSSYARKQEGTGLGLTLTKKLIEIHNGYIDFESKENKGTKFWFILPGAETV